MSERGLPVGCKPSEAGKHASIALPTAGLHPRAASPQAAHLFQVAGGIRLQLEQSPLHRLLADDRWRAGTSIALPAAGLHPRAASPQAAHLFQVAGGIRHPLEPPPLHCSTVVDESAGSEGSVMGTQHRHFYTRHFEKNSTNSQTNMNKRRPRLVRSRRATAALRAALTAKLSHGKRQLACARPLMQASTVHTLL